MKINHSLLFLVLGIYLSVTTVSKAAGNALQGATDDPRAVSAKKKKPPVGPKPLPTPIASPTPTSLPSPIPPSPLAVAPGLYINASGSPVIPMIQAASQSIDIEIYTMYDAKVRNALRDAIAKKIAIRIIQEPAPYNDVCQPFTQATSSDAQDCADEKLLIQQVQAAGGTYIPYNKATLCRDPNSPCYLHGKLMVIDQQLAMMSTGNYDSTNLCDSSQSPTHCDRDYSYVDADSDVVSALEKIINQDLIGKSYDLSAILVGSVSQKLTVSPLSLAPLVKFVQSATTTLDVQNQYLNQTDWNNALEIAAKSGVQVTVQVSSVCWYGTPSNGQKASNTAIYTAFDSAGIHTSMFTKSILINGVPGYLHAKVMVADGNRAWLGSVNGSNSATSNNREFGVFFSDPASVASLKQQIQDDRNAAGAETWQQSLSCAKD